MASVPSASAFSLPIPSWQQPQSARVARYESRKRKKVHDGWDTEDDVFEGETTDAGSEVAPSGTSLILSPEEAHQYRIAGLSFDRELPGGHFPHGPAKDERASNRGKDNVMKGLSSLTPPIYPPQSAAYQGNLRLQHIAVLSSILHRCLLNRDYVRAGRAWGLILREEFRGNPIDVRVEGRWGIGAEILLRRDRQLSDITSGSARSVRNGQKTEASKLCFTREGFEAAKQYYERLIIQYPFRKTAPDFTSSLHFYPAMFGLWVYVTQEESNAARQDIWNRQEVAPKEDPDDAASDPESSDGSSQETQSLVADIRAIELHEAQKIAARMDEVLVSPPYSDSPELLELRGMVSLWIGDLFMSSLAHRVEDNDGFDDNDLTAGEDFQNSIQARREQRLADEKRQSEVEKAHDLFEKAKQRGKGMTSTLEDLHIDDNALFD
ncbi:hypothetical protein F9C07_5694 [Aspergillus flavus]|uniref:Uncharacterized protein n=3 Tax=Aspergillus subgen. Circumdati TaxID=2720871 RepID=B8NAZ2_ASPFN|nr:uncharacterized protein G4B84_010744 [Aspergillus flavus NRRL3357]KAB8253188.1 hypothetical protein BDV35DRAFT_333056 [Aspergillus flavus]KJJ32313.1 hypothetical protein AFLA70_320g001131 [Aspergillus flavus AF70]GMF72035.1 unnamed protein product [Aspergillus oryzae]GMG50242.1 unnamed protein product [Aspergillus oryzae var. brunneus]KAF7624226.1 hypothetical protein AFLA_007938 [Aspergillus flavus NRRL3357]